MKARSSLRILPGLCSRVVSAPQRSAATRQTRCEISSRSVTRYHFIFEALDLLVLLLPSMALATLATNPQPLATVSHSRQNHLNHSRSFSGNSEYDDLGSPASRPHPQMSFSMSQGSQGSNLIMQSAGPFRQYEGSNGLNRRNSAPQIYSVSSVPSS